jgi:hypothetical protein
MKSLRVLTLIFSILAINLVGVTSAQAVDNGSVACVGGGSFDISSNVVTYSNSCVSAVIPEGVTAIGEYAFYNATSLTSVTIPNSVTFIGESAFSRTSLTSVTIPNSVLSIGESAFYLASKLASVTIPNSIVSIGDSAFGQTKLISVTIPNSVTSIGSYAFANMSTLTSFTFGNSSTSIPEGIFQSASGLTSITIPSGVTSIGAYAFFLSTALANVYFSGSSAPSVGSAAFSAVKAGAKAYIQSGATGFGEIGSTWNGLLVSAAPASEAEIAAAALAAQRAAEAKREAEKQSARSEIVKNYLELITPRFELFATAEISEVTVKNLPYISNEIFAFAPISRSDILNVIKISNKYRILDAICVGDRFTRIYAQDLARVGLIPKENQTGITYALRMTPASDRDSYFKISSVINEQLAIIKIRKERLQRNRLKYG